MAKQQKSSKKKLLGQQNYPRIEDNESRFYLMLDEHQLVPHTTQISTSVMHDLIFSAIKRANQKSSREILSIPENASEEEIKTIYTKEGKALFKYFNHYPGDPAATAFEIQGKHYRDVGTELFRNRKLQKERMNSGWRYQFLAVDCAQESKRFRHVSPIGTAEGDFNAIIDMIDRKKPPVHLYVSVKNRSDTLGGQDWPKAIAALETVANNDQNRTGPYCCVFGIAMDGGMRRMITSKKTKQPYSLNTELWKSDFFWPFFANYSYEEIMKLMLEVLLATQHKPETLPTLTDVPDALLTVFGEHCMRENLVDELGNFCDPHQLVQFFCQGTSRSAP